MYNEYLERTEYVDYDDPAVKSRAKKLRTESPDELSLIRNTYYFVRDEVKHPCWFFLSAPDPWGYARYRILHSCHEYGICEQAGEVDQTRCKRQ